MDNKNTDILLSLTQQEINAVLQTIGQLPTSSNAWPLLMKIKEQTEVQLSENRSNDN